MMEPVRPCVLILGATGNTGKHAVRHALDAGNDVHVLVRNPDKLLPAVKELVHILVGELTDPSIIRQAVTAASPTAIIICSGHPPKDAIAPLNSIVVETIVTTLTDASRLDDCFVVYLSGLFSDLPSDPLPWFAKLLRAILVPMSGFQASLQDNLEVTKYLTTGPGSRSGLRFTIVRMGYPIEAPSRGAILPVEYNPRKPVTFDDMGLFLVKLAGGEYRNKVIGKAIKPLYQNL